LLRLGQDAEQVLHVVTDLVRDHVGLRELTGLAADVAAAKARRDLIEERGVEIDLLVRRTIERPHRALRHPAAIGARGAAVENQNRSTLCRPARGEPFLPRRLGAPAPFAAEAALAAGGGAAPPRRRGPPPLRLPLPAQVPAPADEHARIDAERPADQAERDDR